MSLGRPSQATIAFEVCPLYQILPLAITAFGGSDGYFSLAIMAFGAFEVVVPKYQYRLGKMESKESRHLNLRRLGSSRQVVVSCRTMGPYFCASNSQAQMRKSPQRIAALEPDGSKFGPSSLSLVALKRCDL